jgi:predicted  nucleic acid-binding Zn-ribbon protein
MALVMEIRTLQEIDDEAAKLRGTLEDVQRRLQGSPELDATRTRFAAAETQLAEVRRAQRKTEGEVEGLTARIAPEEKRLYDGSVRNPKELSSIQHELELLKGQRSKLEDELLEVMTRLEAAEGEHKSAQKAMLQAEARWEAERESLEQQTTQLQAQITRSDAKREAQKMKVSPFGLTKYEDIRKRRGGVAIARVAGGNCGACRVGIPEAVRKQAFGDGLAQCPNCERILYVG